MISEECELDRDQSSDQWRFNRTIGLGDIIVVIIVMFSMITSYFSMSNRVEKLEKDNEIVQSKVIPTMNRLNQTLDLLNQRLNDYPLHQHIQAPDEKSRIIYPSNVTRDHDYELAPSDNQKRNQ